MLIRIKTKTIPVKRLQTHQYLLTFSIRTTNNINQIMVKKLKRTLQNHSNNGYTSMQNVHFKDRKTNRNEAEGKKTMVELEKGKLLPTLHILRAHKNSQMNVAEIKTRQHWHRVMEYHKPTTLFLFENMHHQTCGYPHCI